MEVENQQNKVSVLKPQKLKGKRVVALSFGFLEET